MIIGTLKEKKKFENRVAISPDEVKSYLKSGHQVLIEKGAGSLSGFTDKSYKEAGATITNSKEVLKTSEIIINENLENRVVDNNKDESNISLKPNILKETSISNETSAIANERIPKEEMVLKSSGNSWVEIEDLDGNSYLTRLMRSGETFVVPDKKGLTLSTGNAGVLSLTFGSTHISKLGSVGEVISSRPLNIEAFKKR